MATADRSFINAEQRAYTWLKGQLADIDGGINGYIGELPIALGDKHPVVRERQMWMFAFTGQNETMTANVGQPAQCHKATAVFRAMLEERETALLIIGRLRQILPGEIHAKVQRLDLLPGLSGPSRDTVELQNDQSIGGLYRVWLIEQPLWIQFSNDDEEIGYEG